MNNKMSSLLDSVLELAEAVVFAVFVVVFTFTFLFRYVGVEGQSMENTFYNNDKLIVTHLFYTPENNDVVVVKSDILGEFIIKRVVAVSGQKLVIDYNSDSLWVCADGEEPNESNLLCEDYIKESDMLDPHAYFSDNHYDEDSQTYEYSVPFGYVFVMGDNRNNSTDSRMIGLVSVDDIVGKAVVRIYSEKAEIGFLN